MLQIAPRYVGQVVYGFGWGGGAVGKAVAGEEAGQVVGDRRIQGGEPLGRLGDFLVAVVQAGDDERRYFQVTAGCGSQHFYGVLHSCQVAADEVVEALGEALQVDVRGIDERCHLVQRAVVHVAVGYQHVDQATLVGEARGAADELEAHERLVVGEGEPMLPSVTSDAAASTNSAGAISRQGTSRSPAQAMEAFWQNGQRRLQP